MKKWIKNMMVILCAMTTISCSQNDDESSDNISGLMVEKTSYTIENEEQTLLVEIKSSVDWTVENVAEWITPETLSGSKNGVLKLKIAANKGKDNRSAKIVLKSSEASEVHVYIAQYAPLASSITVDSGTTKIKNKEFSKTGYLVNGKLYDYKYTLDVEINVYGSHLASQAGWEISSENGTQTYTVKIPQGLRGKAPYGLVGLKWYMHQSPGNFIYKGFAIRKSDGKKIYGTQKTIVLK